MLGCVTLQLGGRDAHAYGLGMPYSTCLSLAWVILDWLYFNNKTFSSSNTSSRKPYTSSKQQERHNKHTVLKSL